ncbi:hypothetical protein [Micromonospora echinofusca]|uniref:hypothetical protein n=1 Tax=Micromonospora echinofusca TaxID=47858 RepID=UPI0027DCC66F|nr:hypothetical protein [Micromonospora echinofusca]
MAPPGTPARPPGATGQPWSDSEEPDDWTERNGPRRARRDGDGSVPQPRATDRDDAPDDEPDEEIEVVPVRRQLSLTVAGFAALLGLGLVLGAQTAGPGHRLPFAVVVFGVQVLFVLAWTMAIRPPAWPVVGAVSVAVAAAVDAAAVLPEVAGLAPLGFVTAGGFVLAVLGQLVRRVDRVRVTDSLGATLLIVIGVMAFATLIVLTRIPAGTQSIFVCLTATAVALAVARLVDAFFPLPRLAPQVPRGATGVVVGAMVGTLASGIIGSYLLGFTPTSAAVVGLVTAATAVLADLAVGYAEAGRLMAGEPPTMWIARHMQGPTGGFALAAPAAYAMCVLFLT